jgi:hypothetical protein
MRGTTRLASAEKQAASTARYNYPLLRIFDTAPDSDY